MSIDVNALFSLKGRTCIVTGASSGLGRHFARSLASVGATVVVAARRIDRVDEVVSDIEQSGGVAIGVSMDVTSAESVRAALEKAQREVGVIALVVNNAGVASTRPLLEHSEHTWDETIDSNLKGAFLVATEAARRMVAA